MQVDNCPSNCAPDPVVPTHITVNGKSDCMDSYSLRSGFQSHIHDCRGIFLVGSYSQGLFQWSYDYTETISHTCNLYVPSITTNSHPNSDSLISCFSNLSAIHKLPCFQESFQHSLNVTWLPQSGHGYQLSLHSEHIHLTEFQRYGICSIQLLQVWTLSF